MNEGGSMNKYILFRELGGIERDPDPKGLERETGELTP